MKRFWNWLLSFRNGQIPDRYLLKGSPMEERLNRSPAPWILTIVLVWITSSVLLVLSVSSSYSAGEITVNSPALRDFIAPAEFKFSSSTENARRKQQLLDDVPLFCRSLPRRTAEIQRDLTDLFTCVETRAAAAGQKRKYELLKGSLASKLTADMSESLLAELNLVYKKNRNYENFQLKWKRMLGEGILPAELRDSGRVATRVRTIDGRTRIREAVRMGDMTDARQAANLLTAELFPGFPGDSAREFRKILLRIIGDGNLQLDNAMREKARSEALKTFKPQVRTIQRGELLIKNGEVVTPELMELAAAAERSIPPELQPVVFYRAFLSLVLLAVTIFFLYRTYPELVGENRGIMLTGAIICISLLANYAALKFFNLIVAGHLSNPVTAVSLRLFLPLSLCAVILTVLASYRAAICASFFTVTVTVLMLSPAHPFEAALKFLTLAALMGLMVRKVTNYRTFFVRTFIGTALIGLILNCDQIFVEPRSLRELAEVAAVAGFNAFVSAVLSLVLIFFFELVCNVSTDMSLMVLCDYNHFLLERMKREAPGTLFHSMTVATLAEDAARAIGANPLKAKAAALFHDIGKLEKAAYFIENNSRSDELHRRLAPVESAHVILEHVTGGLRLARKYRLCRLVRDAIRTHHGDTLVYFFYAKAKAENPDGKADESLFRYGGRPPRSRELTLLSLADACEAAVRSLDHHDPEAIRTKVSEIFLGRFRERQMRNSILTLKELDKVKESFIATLISIHHGRIAYTAESINEAAAQQMEQSQTSGTSEKRA